MSQRFHLAVLVLGVISRKLGGRGSPKFPRVIPVLESFSSDLLQAIMRYWADSHLELCQKSTMELCRENNQQL